MMDALKEMMAKKKSPEGKMSEDEMKAKMDVIQELLEMAQNAMGSHVKGGMDEMKKVSVMAPDTESLAEGLDLAEDVVTDGEGDESTEQTEESPFDVLKKEKDEDDKEDGDDEMPNIFAQRREKSKRGY
jgi:hypothetical protein